jgi:hypothetical protein
MSSRVRVWLAVPAVLLGASASASAQETWEAFDFRHTKYIEYAVSMTSAGETKNGTTIMEFAPQGGDQVQLHFKASLGGTSSEFTTTAPENDIFGQALGQIMMGPASAPLLVTIFSPFWGMYFIGHDLSIGSGWSFDEGGESQSMKVEAACSYAGLDGVEVVWRQSDTVRSRSCVNKTVPLPLAVTMITEENETYAVELKKYERR